MSDDDDKIGYGKPPKHSRFQKGRSGNPRGRPKRSRNLKTAVKELLATRVRITRDGVPRKVSAQDAALLRLCDMGLGKGNLKAIEKLLALAQTYNDEEPSSDQPPTLSDDDREILKSFLKRQFGDEELPAKDADDEKDEQA